MKHPAFTEVAVQRISRAGAASDRDAVAVEEPLEIRVEGRPFSVTMRTPGQDLELVAGYLYSEGVIDGPDDLQALTHLDDPRDPQGNTVHVRLAAGVPALRVERARRERFASSACGVCGKASLDAVLSALAPLERRLRPDPEVLLGLVARLEQDQAGFHRTGGLHAAALFSPEGALEVAREDIGRHNAVDKVLGWRLLADRVPVDDRLLLVSGRAGFEIVQKAVVARVPLLASVGAPSSLAVQLAAQAGLALVGFLRDGRYNLYAPGGGEAGLVGP